MLLVSLVFVSKIPTTIGTITIIDYFEQFNMANDILVS